jgi:hypothetical protein
VPNRWLEWTPGRGETTGGSSTHEPSKPSKLGFEGFEGQRHGLFPIIRRHQEDTRSGADAIEKAGVPDPSKPSEPVPVTPRNLMLPAMPNVVRVAGVHPNKLDALVAVGSSPVTCALSCYEIEPGMWIHRPWDGCKTSVPALEPCVPSRADCGCDGPVCSRCYLCPKHCQCLLPHMGLDVELKSKGGASATKCQNTIAGRAGGESRGQGELLSLIDSMLVCPSVWSEGAQDPAVLLLSGGHVSGEGSPDPPREFLRWPR